MTLCDLIEVFRAEANDRVMPHLWPAEDVIRWLNDAQQEAAIRGRLILDTVEIVVDDGVQRLPIPLGLYELLNVSWLCGDAPLRPPVPVSLVSVGDLHRIDRGWASWELGVPVHAVQTDRSLHLAPAPKRAGILSVTGCRLPVAMAQMDDVPEINPVHHRHLVQWALSRAFLVPDSEAFDPQRADRAEAEFTQYFGVRPDSDLRRSAHTDTPHTIKPFWI